MLRYLAIRIGAGVVLVWVAMTLIFLMLQAIPGDPAIQILGGSGGDISPEALERVRSELGLDRPVMERYGAFVLGVLTGDFGNSFAYSMPVVDLIWPRLQVTFEIGALALILGTAVGIILGAVAARRRGVTDSIITAVLSIFISVPVYVVGAVFVLVFALLFHVLPSGGFTSIAEEPGTHLQQLALPVTALSLPVAAVVGRMSRSAVLENSQQDWVRTARSWGVPNNEVFNRHVLRNSLTSVATVIGLQAGTLIGSTVLIERIFNLPGVGTLLIDAVTERDYPVVQAVVIILSICFIVLSMLVDIAYGILDPRVRRKAL